MGARRPTRREARKPSRPLASTTKRARSVRDSPPSRIPTAAPSASHSTPSPAARSEERAARGEKAVPAAGVDDEARPKRPRLAALADPDGGAVRVELHPLHRG